MASVIEVTQDVVYELSGEKVTIPADSIVHMGALLLHHHRQSRFHYRSEAQAKLQIEHVFDALDELIAEHRRNPLFDHLIGHIYSVEQGDPNNGRGYHIHAAYFFNGNEVRGDVFKAIQLGELCEDVTHSQGYMYSCNHDKELYGDKCGIGCWRRLRIVPVAEMSLTESVHREPLPLLHLCRIGGGSSLRQHVGQFGVGANSKGYLVGRAVYLQAHCAHLPL